MPAFAMSSAGLMPPLAPRWVDMAPSVVPKWCHEPGPVCREPQPPARGRRRGRRRGGPSPRRAPRRAAGGGHPAQPAGRAGGGGRGDHHRTGAGIGRAAPARTRPRVRGHTTTGRPVRRRPSRGCRRPAPGLPRGRRGGDVADQPPDARSPQGPDRAGGRERGAVGQRLARASGRRRAETNRGPVPSTRTTGPARRPALHGLGALTNARRNCNAYLRYSRADLRHRRARRRRPADRGQRPHRHHGRGAPERRRQEARRDRRRAHPGRVRRRPAAHQGAQELEAAHLPRRRRVDRRADRAAGRLPPARRHRGGGTALPGSPRRVPLQDRRRRYPARPGGGGAAPDRRRRPHRGAGRRRCRAHHWFRLREDRPHRRRGGGQELQRRYLDRRGHRKPAGERGQRPDLHRSGARDGCREVRQRRRPPRRGRAWRRPRPDRIRQGRDRDPRRGRRLAGPQHALRQRAQRPGRRRASGVGRGRGRGPRPHLLRGHHHQPLRRERHRKGRDMTSPTARSAIAAAGLRKSFGDKVVLDGIDLQVAEGTIFALLGPNGAGKTTMVQILSTLIGADAGEVAVGGHDLAQEPDAVRWAIGVTGQFSAVDHLLTGEENLLLMADLRHLDRAEGRRRAAELLGRFELVEAAGKPAGTYSGGMRRRLDLAMGLIGDPRIIFLDEPTTGLDPRSRRTMWQIIRDLVAGGVTIFLTTQYLEEADELADRIALLDLGRLVAEGTADELKRRIPGGHIRLQFAYPTTSRRPPAPSGGDPRRRGPYLAGSQRRRRQVAAGPARPARRRLGRGRQPVDPHPGPRRRLPDPHRPARQGQGARPMSTLTYAVVDSATMLRRQLRHMLRYVSMTLTLIGMPIVLLLLFVYVFGGTLGAGLGGPAGGREEYLEYVLPGVLLIAVAT